MEKRKVIIIGAGLAGLAAAYELSKHPELELHILEENSEVGGRVCTKEINGQAVDFGGFIIYPWYTHFHELIGKLKCKSKLKKIPLTKLYYDIQGDGVLQDDDELKIPLTEIVQLWLKTFPKLIIDNDPTQPHLHYFDHLSVKDYLKKLNLKEKEDFYIRMFDTLAQGYCYGSVEEYKMAFTSATMRQNILYGDINSAFYFPCGTQFFAKKMERMIKSNGGVFHFNVKTNEVLGNKILTNEGDFFADEILFAQPQSEVKYTHFITATVEFENSVLVKNKENWGACFYTNNGKFDPAILSAVNLRKLYTNKMDRYVNLNIKITNPAKFPPNEANLFQSILSQLESRFPGATPLRVIKMVPWKKAMPIADEKFVDELIKNQGKDGHYFAGDFLGCPSMETALMTGKRAAAALMAR